MGLTTNEIKQTLMQALYNYGGLLVDKFQGCNLHECDVLRITEANLSYEYEIKASRSDFKNDFKKTNKHDVLKGKNKNEVKFCSYRKLDMTEEWMNENYGSPGRCNFFYYVSEEFLIKESEIPPYSGLIYIVESKGERSIKIVKKAPKLHSFKAGEKLIRKICSVLSARNIFGSSYMHYKNKENQKRFDEWQNGQDAF